MSLIPLLISRRTNIPYSIIHNILRSCPSRPTSISTLTPVQNSHHIRHQSTEATEAYSEKTKERKYKSPRSYNDYPNAPRKPPSGSPQAFPTSNKPPSKPSTNKSTKPPTRPRTAPGNPFTRYCLSPARLAPDQTWSPPKPVQLPRHWDAYHTANLFKRILGLPMFNPPKAPKTKLKVDKTADSDGVSEPVISPNPAQKPKSKPKSLASPEQIEAHNILETLIRTHPNRTSTGNVNVVVWGILIDALGKAGRWKRMFKVFYNMRTWGERPTQRTYAIILGHAPPPEFHGPIPAHNAAPDLTDTPRSQTSENIHDPADTASPEARDTYTRDQRNTLGKYGEIYRDARELFLSGVKPKGKKEAVSQEVDEEGVVDVEEGVAVAVNTVADDMVQKEQERDTKAEGKKQSKPATSANASASTKPNPDDLFTYPYNAYLKFLLSYRRFPEAFQLFESPFLTEIQGETAGWYLSEEEVKELGRKVRDKTTFSIVFGGIVKREGELREARKAGGEHKEEILDPAALGGGYAKRAFKVMLEDEAVNPKGVLDQQNLIMGMRAFFSAPQEDKQWILSYASAILELPLPAEIEPPSLEEPLRHFKIDERSAETILNLALGTSPAIASHYAHLFRKNVRLYETFGYSHRRAMKNAFAKNGEMESVKMIDLEATQPGRFKTPEAAVDVEQKREYVGIA